MSELSSVRTGASAWTDKTYLRAVWSEIAKDRLIYLAIALHVLGAAVLAWTLGAPEKLVFFAYLGVWLPGVAAVLALYLLAVEAPPCLMAGRGRRLTHLRLRAPDVLNPRVPAALCLILALILLHGSFTAVKNMLADLSPFQWDQALAMADRTLHGGRDPWLWLQPLLGHHWVTRVLQLIYTLGWVTALCVFTTLLALSRRLEHLRIRFFVTYVLCWVLIGNLMAGLFLSAGPVYYGEVTGDLARFGAQEQYLGFSKGMAYSSFDLQHMLWTLHEQGRTQLGTGISAFPSLHVSMATLFALTAWAIDRRWGWLATAFLVITMAGSVHLGWHYALDGYVAVVVTVAIWFGVGGLERRLAR